MTRSTVLRGSVVALAALVLGGALLASRHREPLAPLPARHPAPRAASVPRPAPPEAVEAPSAPWVEPPEATPLDASPESQTARAMDDAGLRFQVARLRMAALGGDPDVTESVQAGLRLYGRRADALLARELAHEQDPVVREALAEARKSLR